LSQITRSGMHVKYRPAWWRRRLCQIRSIFGTSEKTVELMGRRHKGVQAMARSQAP
jgi:hypothetical protein